MGTTVGGGARRRRVRNANAPSGGFPPSVVAKTHIWIDAGQEAYADGAICDTVHDWSGHHYDFITQSSPSRSPRFLLPGTINGKPSFNCDLVSGPQMVQPVGDIMAGIAEAELYIVCKYTGSGFGGLHRFGGAGCWMPYDTLLHIYDTFGKASAVGKWDGTTSSPISLANPVLINERAFAAGWQGLINGKLDKNYAVAEAVGFPAQVMLWRNNAGDSFKGEIAEMIVTNQILTGAEQLALQNYFLTKYNIALIP